MYGIDEGKLVEITSKPAFYSTKILVRLAIRCLIGFDFLIEYDIILCGLNIGRCIMKHIKTLNKGTLKETASHAGCGECQTSCQSACKTSCTVANQECENK